MGDPANIHPDDDYDYYNYDYFLNITNSTLEDVLYDGTAFINTASTRVLPVFFIIIFVVGVVGNGLVVYVFARNKSMRTVTNGYLLNLALIDLIYLFLCAPFSVVYLWHGYWPFGDSLCKIFHYLLAISMSVNVLTLTAVGIDRYFIIKHPMKTRQFRTLRKTAAVLVVIWVLSLVLMIPAPVFSKEVSSFSNSAMLMFCIEGLDVQSERLYVTVMFTAYFLAPQLIVGFCYFQVGKKLWLSIRPGIRLNFITIETLKTRRRIAKMVFVVTVAFTICWLPCHITYLHDAYGTPTEAIGRFKMIVPLFSYATTAINPLIYFFMSKTFRKYFKAAFTCEKVQISPLLLAEYPVFIDTRKVDERQPDSIQKRPGRTYPPRLDMLIPQPQVVIPVQNGALPAVEV